MVSTVVFFIHWGTFSLLAEKLHLFLNLLNNSIGIYQEDDNNWVVKIVFVNVLKCVQMVEVEFITSYGWIGYAHSGFNISKFHGNEID